MAMTDRNGGEAGASPLTPPSPEVASLAEALIRGERRALARAITLVESTRADHRRDAETLLATLAGAQPGDDGGAVRIGLSGAPGVGKSTFIETFGMALVDAGERVAVLAVDPSSRRGGGAILGDKTRMERLSRRPEAFIRPSSAGDTLGGVARRTREAVLLAEAWGASVVIVETVGVGQSETAVADLTDVFALLIGPAAGDELQGVKRGVMELADFVVVTKADGALADQARLTASDYAGALRLLRRRSGDPDWIPVARSVSAATGDGVAAFWAEIQRLDAWRRAGGWRARRRRDQAAAWLRAAMEQALWDSFSTAPAVAAALPGLEAATADGRLSPDAAAAAALAAYRSSDP